MATDYPLTLKQAGRAYRRLATPVQNAFAEAYHHAAGYDCGEFCGEGLGREEEVKMTELADRVSAATGYSRQDVLSQAGVMEMNEQDMYFHAKYGRPL